MSRHTATFEPREPVLYNMTGEHFNECGFISRRFPKSQSHIAIGSPTDWLYDITGAFKTWQIERVSGSQMTSCENSIADQCLVSLKARGWRPPKRPNGGEVEVWIKVVDSWYRGRVDIARWYQNLRIWAYSVKVDRDGHRTVIADLTEERLR